MRMILAAILPLFVPVESFISQYKWNQELVNALRDDYEVVYPFRVDDGNRVHIDTKDYYYKNGTHYEEVTFVIRSASGRYKLELKKNSLLSPRRSVHREILSSGARTVSSQVEDCFYQGTVRNQPDAAVAASTCAGLKAVIFLANETIVLVPLKGGDMDRRHPHLLFRATWHGKVSCADTPDTGWNPNSNLRQRYSRGRQHRTRRDAAKQTKYIELGVIADYSLAAEWDFKFQYIRRSILETLNIVDLLYFRALNTKVSLTFLEVWLEKNLVTWSSDIAQTAVNVLNYVSRELYTETKDMVIYLTPNKFQRKEHSMTTPGSVCTARAVGISQVTNIHVAHENAAVVSHTIGHILGIKHDEDAAGRCQCDSPSGCTMRSTIGGKRYSFAHDFSTCSRDEYLTTLRLGQGRCLFNKPLREDKLAKCGNKIVDPDEDCDCGDSKECNDIDPCCDPVTCKLRAEAQCAAGPCCDGCKLKPAGTACREVFGQCDVPEFCTGDSGQCPTDAVKMNGSPCADGVGVCFQGRCSTHSGQCARIWGQGAVGSDLGCYQRFNTKGTVHGHCGLDEDGRKRPCDLVNVGCGLLHCRGGEDIPILDGFDGLALKTEVAHQNQSLECKVVSDKQVGMVSEGTKCADKAVCLNGACVPIVDVSPPHHCPTNNLAFKCSGHGACTTENWCHCDYGWKGEDCSRKAFYPTTTQPSLLLPPNGNAESRLSTMDLASLLIILAGVAGGVIVVLGFLLICYRRRTTVSLRKKAEMSGRVDFECCSNSSVDTAHRSIKFGNMPSYRDEKLQRKRQRRTLHRIHEVSDERDSVSNRSKESGERHSLLNRQSPRDHAPPPLSPQREEEEPTFDSTNQRLSPLGAPPNAYSTHNMQDDRHNGAIAKNKMYNRSISEAEALGPLMPAVVPAHAVHSADGGYESEPPIYSSYRVFERSLRRLEEYECTSSPYHAAQMAVSARSAMPALYQTSPQSEYWDERDTQQQQMSSRRSNVQRHHREQRQQSHGATRSAAGMFSPQTARASTAASTHARNGYATDTELQQASWVLTPGGRRRRMPVEADSDVETTQSDNPWKLSLPPRHAAASESGAATDRDSPTNSVASSSRCALAKPTPIKLTNIEYLLKQLDNTTADQSLSPSSSTELSPAEADKEHKKETDDDTHLDDDRLDESSNTESHRDAVDLYQDAIRQAHDSIGHYLRQQAILDQQMQADNDNQNQDSFLSSFDTSKSFHQQ